MFLTGSIIFSICNLVLVYSQCTSEGRMCRKQCKELVQCTDIGNNTFSEQVIQLCAGTPGRLCDAVNANCESDFCYDDGLNKPILKCYEEGKFPHPTDCRQYYNCIKNESFTIANAICLNGTSYNSINGNCSSSADTRACNESPIPKCTQIGNRGAYPEDTAVYYVCAYDSSGYLRPELHRCLQGFAFSDEETKCVLISGAVKISGRVTVTAILVSWTVKWFL